MVILLILEIPNIERELCLHEIWCESLILRRSRVLCSFCPRRNQKTCEQAKEMFSGFSAKTRTSVNGFPHADPAVRARAHPARASVQRPSVVVYTWDTRFGSVWKAWHFVVIHENVSLTLQLRRILSKSSMWKCRTSYSNISKKYLSKKCLLAVDAATMCRVESTLISWRRQYHWQAGGPFHYSLIVELKFDGKYW